MERRFVSRVLEESVSTLAGDLHPNLRAMFPTSKEASHVVGSGEDR
jgi:hypothetical protein